VVRLFFLIAVIRSSSGLSITIALSMSAISVCVVCLHSMLVDEKWLKNEEIRMDRTVGFKQVRFSGYNY
jgi:hypothetical protein